MTRTLQCQCHILSCWDIIMVFDPSSLNHYEIFINVIMLRMTLSGQTLKTDLTLIFRSACCYVIKNSDVLLVNFSNRKKKIHTFEASTKYIYLVWGLGHDSGSNKSMFVANRSMSHMRKEMRCCAGYFIPTVAKLQNW